MLSMTTDPKMNIPPIRVVMVGISDKKTAPIRIPYTGCTLLMILTEVIEKCLNVSKNSVWPMAVVITANAIIPSHCDRMVCASIKNKVGNSKNPMIPVWYTINIEP